MLGDDPQPSEKNAGIVENTSLKPDPDSSTNRNSYSVVVTIHLTPLVDNWSQRRDSRQAARERERDIYIYYIYIYIYISMYLGLKGVPIWIL